MFLPNTALKYCANLGGLLTVGFLVLFAVVALSDGQPALLVGFLSTHDKAALKRVFDGYQVNDVHAIYHAAMGSAALGETFRGTKEACQELARATKSANLEQIYFGVMGSELLKTTCGSVSLCYIYALTSKNMRLST